MGKRIEKRENSELTYEQLEKKLDELCEEGKLSRDDRNRILHHKLYGGRDWNRGSSRRIGD